MSNRRDFLRQLGLLAVGAALTPELELIEKVRRFFPSAEFPEQYRMRATFDMLIAVDYETHAVDLKCDGAICHGWFDWRSDVPMPPGVVRSLKSVEIHNGPRCLLHRTAGPLEGFEGSPAPGWKFDGRSWLHLSTNGVLPLEGSLTGLSRSPVLATLPIMSEEARKGPSSDFFEDLREARL